MSSVGLRKSLIDMVPLNLTERRNHLENLGNLPRRVCGRGRTIATQFERMKWQTICGIADFGACRRIRSHISVEVEDE